MSPEKDESNVHPIPVLEDNIIWVWTAKNEAVVIDPALTDPVQDWLERHELTLKAILQTHHHTDHIGGSLGLLRLWPKAEVIASKKDLGRIPFQTKSVKNKDKIKLMGESIEVIEVPGHTSNHIAFFIPGRARNKYSPLLFCGDTLFSGGCGRLFEGTAKEMFNSLMILKRLPPETKVYCAHEYTESNLRWANELYPKDHLIKRKLIETIKKRANHEITLPTSIQEENEINLFLRSKNFEELARLRKHKDNW
tara:strand:- start:26 stop:781 length:756 start_codon:yes stop_codon:yes gene_type:complete